MENADNLIDVFDIPCCPFCDNAIYDYESFVVCEVRGAVFICHMFCLMTEREERKGVKP